MKLGLLVVLAVAVVLPSISESRTVTRCELREKLMKTIRLPRRLARFREEVVAIVTCEVARRSRLDTNRVKIFGKRKLTTTAKPTIPTTAAGNETQSPDVATTVSKTKAPTTTTTTTTTTTKAPTTTTKAPTTTTKAPTTTTTTTTTTTKAPTTTTTTTTTTTKAPTTTTKAPTTTTTTTTTTTKAPTTTTKAPTTTTTSTTTTIKAPTTTTPTATTARAPTSQSVTRNSNSTVDGGRKKRAASSSKNNMELDMSLEQMLNEEETKFNEEEMVEDDDHLESDENSSEEDTESPYMDGRRNRRSPHRRRSKKRVFWSLGFYGLFQLSDSHFCNSGYRWSRNVCRKSCSAFVDDDITDDVACVARSGYWRRRTLSQQGCKHPHLLVTMMQYIY